MSEADIDKVELNRKHFDEQASTYNTRWQKTIEQLIVEIQNRKEWIGIQWADGDDSSDSELKSGGSSAPKDKKSVRLLDYACGTGLVSRALLPFITSSTGIDLSSGMVDEFNKLASNQGLSETEMHAHVGNLCSPTPSTDPLFAGPEFYNFDVAAVGLGFHHFGNPSLAAKRLVERLRPGGALVIIDFLPHGPAEAEEANAMTIQMGLILMEMKNWSSSFSSIWWQRKDKEASSGDNESVVKSAQRTIIHHGFAVEDVRKMFEEAGAGKNFDLQEMGKGVVFSKANSGFKREVFIARDSRSDHDFSLPPTVEIENASYETASLTT